MFLYSFTVHTADTDFGGVCHHAEILKKYEQARDEVLKQVGYCHWEQWQNGKVLPVVTMDGLRFIAPLEPGKHYHIVSQIMRHNRFSLSFEQSVQNSNGDSLAQLSVVKMMFADRHNKRREALPQAVYSKLNNLVINDG